MLLRSIVWKGALAALMTVFLVADVSAQRDRDRDRDKDRPKGECKEMLNAAGRAKFRPFTQAREARGEGAAMADAIANWQRDVSAKYGSQWMLWVNADDKKYNCGASRPGKIGSWFIRCTIEARPCGGGEDPEKEDSADYKQCTDYPRHRVLEAQQRANGCNACNRQIVVDGTCGPSTEGCLKTFQNSRFGRQKGLATNGAPDRKTLLALREYCG